MPKLDKTKRPDITDLADDDVRLIPDIKTRESVYRVTQKIKEILLYQMDAIEALYDAVTEIEIDLDTPGP